MAKLYAVNPDTRELLGTSDGEPDTTTRDYARVRGAVFVELDEAISLGATKLNKDGKKIWLGVNVKVKLEDKMLWAWWLGKWRCIREWPYKRKPSEKWVHKNVSETFKWNVPLDPGTIVKTHWED